MPLALTIFIMLLVSFALALDEEGAPPLFAEDLRQSLVAVESSSSQVRAMVEGMAAVDRETLETTVEDSLQAIDDVGEAMGAAPLNDPTLTGPMAILGEVLASWQLGIKGLHTSVLEAADDPLAVGVEIEITDSLIDLRAGDRLYQSFVMSMDAADTPAPVVPFPEIEFVSDTFPFSTGPSQIVSIAKAEGNQLALQAEVAIGGVATVPDIVVNTSDQNVVPTTQTLTINVVVLNSGNTESEPIDVMIDLTGSDGSVLSQIGTAPAIDAGAQTTVEFPEVAVTPGGLYALVVRLPIVEGEEESEDNLRELTFTINEETTSTTSG